MRQHKKSEDVMPKTKKKPVKRKKAKAVYGYAILTKRGKIKFDFYQFKETACIWADNREVVIKVKITEV